jgi:hypothetical protein
MKFTPRARVWFHRVRLERRQHEFDVRRARLGAQMTYRFLNVRVIA